MKKIIAALVTAGVAVAIALPASPATAVTEEAPSVDLSHVGEQVPGAFAPTGPQGFTAKSATPGGAHILAAEYGPCKLYPSVVHLRASSAYGTVGNKPYTKCDVPVTSIHQETKIYKTAFFGSVNLDQGTYSGGNRGVANYTQKNVDRRCDNQLSTTWFAVTDGTVVYGGKTYYSEVISSHETYNCGT